MNRKDLRRESENCGFALVLALAQVALVSILLISMSLFLRVETTHSHNSLELLRAREAAKLALYIALGELQKHAGADSRATARAEILGTSVDDARRYWTGVWDTNQPSDEGPVWLVSGSNPNLGDLMEDRLLVMGPGPFDRTSSTYPDPSVEVPADTITGRNGRTSAKIAWWVSDEGVKATVGGRPLSQENPLNFPDSRGTAATALQLATFHGIEGLFSRYDRFNPENVAESSRIHSINDLTLSNAFLNEEGKPDTDNFEESPIHSLTPFSWGVLANTLPSSDPDSGLMRDLSLYPELPGSGLARYLRMGEDNEKALSGDGVGGLRFFSPVMGPEDLSELKEGDIAVQVAPVLTNLMLAFTVRSHSPTELNPNFYLRMRFFCELWNPYTHNLKLADGEEPELEIRGLPTVTVHKTKEPRASSAPIDIPALIGDPDRPDRPLVIRLKYDEAEQWLPGQSKNWNGVDAASSTGTSPYYSIDRASKRFNATEGALGGITGLNTGEPRLSGNIKHQSSGSNEISIRVYLNNTVSGERRLISELDAFTYEAVSTRPEGYDSTHRGATFGYHILLRGPHYSSNDSEYFRGRWLHAHDPRNPQPDLGPNWYADYDEPGSAAYIPVKDGIQPIGLPLPEEIHESRSPTIEIELFRRLHDRSKGIWSTYFNRLWQDAPLFELPRRRVLSLAALQHLYIHNERPFQIGNSWGNAGATNHLAWFDRYYFSGFSRRDNSEDYDRKAGPPNPTLIPYGNWGHLMLRDWQVRPANDREAARTPAKHLLVSKRFNLNSTSIPAWKAVLGSLRLNRFTYLDYPEEDTSDLSGLRLRQTDRTASFTRFSHSLSETYEATQPPDFIGKEPSAPSAFYRHGARRLSDTQLGDLAGEIVRRLKLKGSPFLSMEAFLSADATGMSLLEQAISGVLAPDGRQKWHHAWELEGSPVPPEQAGIDIDHFSPGFLTQADVITAIGPMLATRSDTFKIRARSQTYAKRGYNLAGAALEAIVQRTPERSLYSGRKFQILSFKWLNSL